MSKTMNSYPKIFAIGHRCTAELLKRPVNIEEKVDGSQFSFGVDEVGNIHARSRGQVLNVDAPEKMFATAVESVRELAPLLHPGWTYRGEYLQKPKHNALTYSRVPRHNIIIFDINTGDEWYMPYLSKWTECSIIGLECVPPLYSGTIESADQLLTFLDRESVLGGPKIEGVVVKPRDYDLFGEDKKCVFGKFVSEAFKEVHRGEWKASNPTNGDILDLLGVQFCAEPRWRKALQHATEQGNIEGSPRDIGTLVKFVPEDIKAECADEIKDALFKWAWPHISRRSVRGLAEWYKAELLGQAFEGGPMPTTKPAPAMPRPTRRPRPKRHETDLYNKLRVAASKRGARLFRNNVGLFYTRNGTPIRCGLHPGSADLIGWMPYRVKPEDVGRTLAIFFSVEAKDPNGKKPEPKQVKWRDAVNSAGGVAEVVDSINQLTEAITNF